MARPLPTEFTFAGFNFPRYIPEVKNGHSRCVYYHAPKPLTGGSHPGNSFYLNDAGGFNRWKYCDEVNTHIRHTGWFCDDFCDSKMRGIVVYLPHGKMLAGWAMGEGMCAGVDGDIYMDEMEAARAADSIAENVAEREREYQEEMEAERVQEKLNQGSDDEEH